MNSATSRTMAVWTLTPLLACATAVTAQYEKPDRQDPAQNTRQTQREMQNQQNRTHSPHFVILDELKGFDVMSFSEETLGEINDAVIKCRSGKVAYVLLGFGGTLGIGEQVVAVPYNAFQFSQQSDGNVTLRLNITEQELDEAPEFDADTWPTADHRQWDDELERFWSDVVEDFDNDDTWDRQERRMPANAEDPNRNTRNQDQNQRERATSRTAQFCLASDLEHADVNTAGQLNTDENSGHIDSLYFECTTGHLAFVGVDPDEKFADIGEVNRIVPFEAIAILPDNEVRLDVTADKMRSGRETPDEARELDRVEVRNRIYQHYGVANRDWNDRNIRDMDDRTNPEVTKALREGTPMNFSGRVLQVRTDAPMSEKLGNMAIVVQTEAGERTIHVGPASKLQSKLMLEKGKQVEGEFIRTTIDGKTVYVLTSIECDGRSHEIRESSGKPTWNER